MRNLRVNGVQTINGGGYDYVSVNGKLESTEKIICTGLDVDGMCKIMEVLI